MPFAARRHSGQIRYRTPAGERGREDFAIDVRETITVPAGTFAGDHYLLRWQPHWPLAKLWVYGPDCVFLRMSWEVSNTTSELVSFATGAGDRSPQFA